MFSWVQHHHIRAAIYFAITAVTILVIVALPRIEKSRFKKFTPNDGVYGMTILSGPFAIFLSFMMFISHAANLNHSANLFDFEDKILMLGVCAPATLWPAEQLIILAYRQCLKLWNSELKKWLLS